MSDLETFRADTRAWLEENCPPEMREPMTSEKDTCWGGRNFQFQSEAQKVWMERMGARGWTVPTWPKEYGGGGLSKAEGEVLAQEMRALGCRSPLNSFGIWMLGPALLKFGTEEQKLQHLPPIARGEIRWCQGYSEPGAGSDLAGVSTRAVDQGDHWEVTGQKVWTSYADQADMIFALVRTDPDAPKHLGISFMLLDMDQPGVDARPIKLISGDSPFCETFFENARAEKGQIVGEMNRGWDVAKYLLTHEREMIGGNFGTGAASKAMSKIAADALGLQGQDLADPVMRSEIAHFEIDELSFGLTMKRMLGAAEAGASLGANASLLKYYGTELNKRRQELLVDIEGLDGAAWQKAASNAPSQASKWLRSKGNSIEGGTTEVQLNIMAKHLLGLPSS